jgi:ABC-2 type transport system permease protein
MAGTASAEIARLLGQACVVALLGIALGARPDPAPLPLLLAVLELALFALGYASLSCWIALRTRAQESMAVFVHLVNMPLLFTSTALVPSRQMPPWLETLAAWNPLTLVANALREAMLFHRMPDPAHLLPLALFGVLLFVVACAAMRGIAND